MEESSQCWARRADARFHGAASGMSVFGSGLGLRLCKARFDRSRGLGLGLGEMFGPGCVIIMTLVGWNFIDIILEL